MAYRLDPARPLPAELDRIVDEQLGRAARRLEGHVDDGDVHDVRKRIKKTRSLLRLARAGLGDARRDANDRLPAVANGLGGARDAAADVEAVDALLRRAPADQATSVAVLRERLAAIAAEVGGHRATAVDPHLAAEAARELRAIARSLRPAHSRVTGWRDLEPGLERQYRLGREHLAGLGRSPSAEDLHEWRKRAKDLGYHALLLRGLWPPVIRPYATEADRLADLLGDDHDLARVAGHLADPDHLGPVDLDADQREGIARVIERERTRLQRRARDLGALLYADAPEAWAARHRAWWHQGLRSAAAR